MAFNYSSSLGILLHEIGYLLDFTIIFFFNNGLVSIEFHIKGNSDNTIGTVVNTTIHIQFG